MRSIELFTGAGGLGMGISKAGFQQELCIEWDKSAYDNLIHNKNKNLAPIRDWRPALGDVRDFAFNDFRGKIDLVAGGPPCQPFSLGGKHKGPQDCRNMFPEMVRAIREIAPKAFIIENVKGLLRESFSKYFEYILLQLCYPQILSSSNDWHDHLSLLEKHHTQGRHEQLQYRVVFSLLNAADFGVPQRRERVFFVGFRSDLNVEWSFPQATHSREALLRSQWMTGEYWERHRVAKKDRPEQPSSIIRPSEKSEQPWLTLRDAISDLPKPLRHSDPAGYHNHLLIPGARSYAGHTGSPMDEPAKTLKAGDHGVPGGENMLVLPDGSVRYLTIRESARLQCFPDEYLFYSPWTESMRQLGNAVPVLLAETIAKHVRKSLAN